MRSRRRTQMLQSDRDRMPRLAGFTIFSKRGIALVRRRGARERQPQTCPRGRSGTRVGRAAGGGQQARDPLAPRTERESGSGRSAKGSRPRGWPQGCLQTPRDLGWARGAHVATVS
eukprot:7337782-Pyramimonas_sp.AAC.2